MERLRSLFLTGALAQVVALQPATAQTAPPTPITLPDLIGAPSQNNPCSGPANHIPGGPDGTGACWPGPNNTGVPIGTMLTPYTGSCALSTAGLVIDSQTVNWDLNIRAANVTIKYSKIKGTVILDTDVPGSNAWSFTLQDSEVDGGQVQLSAVGWGNLRIIRSNIYGGQNSVQCEEKSASCLVQDSYLHGQ